MNHPVITIGREYASGGRSIAQKLAEALSVPFYDKKLIELAAKDTGLTEDFISEAEQQRTTSLLYNLYYNSKNLPLSDQVFITESKIIRRIAAEGPCVIVGRCADYVLHGQENCLHAFLHAPMEQRIQRARNVYGLTEKNIQGYIHKKDRSRASYYNYFTAGRWGDCHSYDLTINTACGEETAVRLLIELANSRRTNND